IALLLGEKSERRHRGPLDAIADGAGEVALPRFAAVAGRDELERAAAVVARVRVNPLPGRPAAVAGQPVALQAMPAIEPSAFSEPIRGEIELHRTAGAHGRCCGRAERLDEKAIECLAILR